MLRVQAEGQAAQLDVPAVVPFQATTAVTASSSAEGKATVSVTGHNVTIHGVEAGNATVTVSAGAGVTATIAVTVTSA